MQIRMLILVACIVQVPVLSRKEKSILNFWKKKIMDWTEENRNLLAMQFTGKANLHKIAFFSREEKNG